MHDYLGLLRHHLSSTLRIYARLLQTQAQKFAASETMRTACSTGAAIATVRRVFWSAPNLSMSRHDRDDVEIPAALWKRLVEALCYAV